MIQDIDGTTEPAGSASASAQFERAMQEALRQTDASDFAMAETSLLEAMRLSPRSATPHFLLAANFAQTGKTQEAEAAFIQCLSRAPDFAIARFQLGLLQLTNGRAVVASATWEPLLGLSDDSYLKRFVQGFLEILLGNRASAERFIRDGIASNTDNPLLNRDMRGVLTRLASIPAVDAIDSEHAAATAETTPMETQETTHFLVGAYRQP